MAGRGQAWGAKHELRAQIVALVHAGKPDREIAAELGISKNTVIGHRGRAGLTANMDASSAKSVGAAERLGTSEPVETLFDRMDALDAKLTRVLAETLGVGRMHE